MKSSYLWSLSLGLLLSCSQQPQSNLNASSLSASAFADTAPSVHGMVLFGTDVLYASHIPMYHAPHNWQALLQVKLSHPQVDAQAAYLKAQGSGAQSLFTLMPKPFVLPRLLDGRLKSFQADIYRGNFEDGGRVVLSNVTVEVQDLTYVAPLSENTDALPALTYFALNTGNSSYLVHKITAPDNFDQAVQIQWLTPELAQKNSVRTFQVADVERSRLKAGQAFQILEDGSIVEAQSQSDAAFVVVSDFYCTTGPDFFSPCN